MSRIIPMSERIYKKVPINEIKVLNKRDRDNEQFLDNVESIKNQGLLKPVVINKRNHKDKGFYELVCGEGRLTAFKRLNKTHIPAEIIDVDNDTAMLFSLVENIARLSPGSVWFARELLRLKEAGMTYKKISQLAGKSVAHIKTYITLIERGEERLIAGVEKKLFPIQFAYQVSLANSDSIQHLLMDAFDSGLINGSNTARIREFIESRFAGYKKMNGSSRVIGVEELKAELQKALDDTEAYTHQIKAKENRLVMLTQYLEDLTEDQYFIELLKKYNLSQFPKLSGEYSLRLKGDLL